MVWMLQVDSKFNREKDNLKSLSGEPFMAHAHGATAHSSHWRVTLLRSQGPPTARALL